MSDGLRSDRVPDALHRPTVRYAPGSWVALAAEHLWLLAEVDPANPVVVTCWEALEQGAGVDHVLGIILREGLRSVPSFVLAGRSESGVRVLVEGKARAELRMPGDAETSLVTADGAPTWTERRVEGPIDLRLMSADDRASSATGGPDAAILPLTGGAALAAELTVLGVVTPPRPASLPPLPDPPIVSAEPARPSAAPARASAEPARRPTNPRHGAPETLQTPIDELHVAHAPTLDHIGGDVDMPDDMPAPAGKPVADLPPPATVLVPGLIESLPTPPDPAQEVTGEIGPRRAAADPELKPWAPPAGPPARSTSIAGIDIDVPAPYTVERSAAPGGTPLPIAPPTLPAVACPNQHLNPPYAALCRICGTPVPPQQTFTVPRPTLGVLTLSTGETVPLDRDVVLGRAPFHPDASAPSRPHLVALTSPGNDISRSHVRIGLEGWHVQVVDLGSINGTVVTLPGQAPVRLRAHDPFTIVPGTTISIADEVSARFDSARA